MKKCIVTVLMVFYLIFILCAVAYADTTTIVMQIGNPEMTVNGVPQQAGG